MPGAEPTAAQGNPDLAAGTPVAARPPPRELPPGPAGGGGGRGGRSLCDGDGGDEDDKDDDDDESVSYNGDGPEYLMPSDDDGEDDYAEEMAPVGGAVGSGAGSAGRQVDSRLRIFNRAFLNHACCGYHHGLILAATHELWEAETLNLNRYRSYKYRLSKY